MSHTLDYLLHPLRRYLDDPAVEELCVNGPGGAFIYAKGAFTFHPLDLSARDIENIAIVAGAQRRQNVGPNASLLATDLDGQGRLQAVLPPNVPEGRPSLTIRRGSTFNPSIEDLAKGGLFSQTRGEKRAANAADERLIALYQAEQWEEFFRAAVQANKTIVACGVTASGKTTFAKALIDSIPLDVRLITIEDTPEWTEIPHKNWVSLLYDKEGRVQAGHLVEAALRMRIGRLLVQEIRDGNAANAFLHALQSGHPGGITTIHATDCENMFIRLRTMVKQTPAGAALSDVDLIGQLQSLIDIVVHCHRPEGRKPTISEVWFSPLSARQAQREAA